MAIQQRRQKRDESNALVEKEEKSLGYFSWAWSCHGVVMSCIGMFVLLNRLGPVEGLGRKGGSIINYTAASIGADNSAESAAAGCWHVMSVSRALPESGTCTLARNLVAL